ncbi:hypothetical protein Q4I28_008158 [Leishmania naiffi]|uniref:Uncharacterized protein n=1 Tax=Leishmania naiffi TaxID=5678 RepID=A0AAW3B1G2_9TRYP
MLSSSSAGAAVKSNTGALTAALTTVKADEDPNVEVLWASKCIHKLTRATDALIARDFVLREEEAILNDLETYLASLEDEVKKSELQTEELRSRTSLLRPDKRRAVVGENAEVSALWKEYGNAMGRLVKQHSLRLEELEKTLATVSARDPELPLPKPLQPPPVVKVSSTMAALLDVSKGQKVQS